MNFLSHTINKTHQSKKSHHICSIVHYKANKTKWGCSSDIIEGEKKLRRVSGFSPYPQLHANERERERVKPLATFHGFETKTFLSDHFHVYSALTWRNAKKIDTLVFIIAVNYFSCTDNFFSSFSFNNKCWWQWQHEAWEMEKSRSKWIKKRATTMKWILR